MKPTHSNRSKQLNSIYIGRKTCRTSGKFSNTSPQISLAENRSWHLLGTGPTTSLYLRLKPCLSVCLFPFLKRCAVVQLLAKYCSPIHAWATLSQIYLFVIPFPLPVKVQYLVCLVTTDSITLNCSYLTNTTCRFFGPFLIKSPWYPWMVGHHTVLRPLSRGCMRNMQS